MGYHTSFEGQFDLDKELKPEHIAYLEAFANTRRMKRDPSKAEALADPIREAVGLPIGPEGAYFVGGDGFRGQDESIVNHNLPPQGQPSLWCQWVPTEEGIVWDDEEKFYEYDVWIEYIIEHFLKPWGYVLNGEVEWKGEDSSDLGKMIVEDNVLTIKQGKIVYE